MSTETRLLIPAHWTGRVVTALVVAMAGAATLRAETLQRETLVGWSRYVFATEQRIENELRTGTRSLSQEYLAGPGEVRRALLSGGIPVDRLESGGGRPGRRSTCRAA